MQIQGVKYQPKTEKKNSYTPKIQIWTFEKRMIIMLPHFWMVKFQDKNKQKKLKQKIWKLFFVKNIQ